MLRGTTTPERHPGRGSARWSVARSRPRTQTARPSGRASRVLLTVLLTVIAVALGGGTWAYSTQLDDDVLLVRHHPTAPFRGDLVVGSYDRGRISLRRDDDQRPDPLPTDDVYGLVWAAGHGVLSGPPTLQPDGEVVRALKVTDGAPPFPGTHAVLTRSVWADPHAAYGVDYRQVGFPCDGGRCPAWYVRGRGSTWLVAVHGRGGARTEPLRAMGPALRAHLPALDIGYRNDADAPADPSGRWGYGTTEWRDLDAAVRWATGHGARHVVLFGASMGGAIVASYLAHASSAAHVTGVVLDSPALDLDDLVDAVNAADRSVPLLGMPIPRGLTSAAEILAAWRTGLDWDATDYRDGSWLHVPALVFHGAADATVPLASSRQLQAAQPALVRLVQVPGAGHVESWNVDPAAYEKHETAFLRCVVGAVSCPTG